MLNVQRPGRIQAHLKNCVRQDSTEVTEHLGVGGHDADVSYAISNDIIDTCDSRMLGAVQYALEEH